jgi:hypothetical protein
MEVQAEYMGKHLQKRIGKMLQAALMAHIDAIKRVGSPRLTRTFALPASSLGQHPAS